MFTECSYRRVEAIGFSKNTPKMIYLSPCQTGLFDAKVLGNLNRCIYFIFWYFWRLMRQALLVNPKILKFEEKLYQIMISKLWHHKCMKKMQMLSNTFFFLANDLDFWCAVMVPWIPFRVVSSYRRPCLFLVKMKLETWMSWIMKQNSN